MKVTNIVLSIIILLLALALAVSSFFLYEKREIMLNGWEKLTTTINETAKEMDKNSGTKLAEELTQDNLHHTNYANLDDQLKKLNEGAARLIKQRDNLASTLVSVSRILEANNAATEEALAKLETSEGVARDVVAQAQTFKERRDAVLNAIVQSGRLIGVSINVNDLKKGNSKKVFDAFNAKLNSLKDQLAKYQRFSAQVGRIAGAPAPNFNVPAYEASLAKISNAVTALKTKYNKSQNDLRIANSKIASLNNTVKQRDQRIKNLNTTITKKETEVKQLKRALGLEPNAVVNPWTDGSKESRRAVKGKVIEVNEKFGFYVVDIGNNTLVDQTIGNRINKINPKIQEKMKITVARNMNSPEVKFISKANITNVADECSIIEVIDSGNKVMVGDDVFFADEDLK
ncbi:MAG: hypothetical protein IKB77_03985 [Lentisphaeria bacterium]|nr:hypothetical protein [Lentisphaeria bacterium]